MAGFFRSSESIDARIYQLLAGQRENKISDEKKKKKRGKKTKKTKKSEGFIPVKLKCGTHFSKGEKKMREFKLRVWGKFFADIKLIRVRIYMKTKRSEETSLGQSEMCQFKQRVTRNSGERFFQKKCAFSPSRFFFG